MYIIIHLYYYKFILLKSVFEQKTHLIFLSVFLHCAQNTGNMKFSRGQCHITSEVILSRQIRFIFIILLLTFTHIYIHVLLFS